MKTSRTLLVSEIVNFTNREMYTYGTSGELVKLRPSGLIKAGRPMVSPEEGAYYALDIDRATEFIASFPCYAGKIIIPIYYGKGKLARKLYNFVMPCGTKVKLVTDGVGYPGSIITENNSPNRDPRFIGVFAQT